MNEPVFIMGPARSGTTLLRALLDKHPRIAGLDELPFFTELVLAFEQLSRPEARAMLDSMQIPSHDELRERFVALHRFPRDAIAKARGKARWVDMTHNQNDWYIDVIDDLYDGECRYLLMVRHPADVIASQFEMGRHSRFPGRERDPVGAFDVGARATDIAKIVSVQREMAEQISERVHTVRYEELVTNPQAVLAAVCRFLGEPELAGLDPESLDLANPIIIGDHKIRTSGSVHARSIGRWKTSLSYEQVSILRGHDALAGAMSAYGYDLSAAEVASVTPGS